MRQLIWALSAALLSGAVPAYSQALPPISGSGAATSQQIADRAAYYAAITNICARDMKVKSELAKEISMQWIGKGQEAFGVDYFNGVLEKAAIAVGKEAIAQGPKNWCAEQRGMIRQTQTPQVFE